MTSKIIDARKLNIILICSAFVLISSVIGGLIMSSFEPQTITAMSEQTTLVEKIIKRDGEIKALWVATVANINFPSKRDLSKDELKAEIDGVLSTVLENSMNTVILQVRPSSDAFYESELFPTSEFLCQSQGNALTLDVLDYIVTEAHKLEIAVCAWVNPLRISTSMNDSKGNVTQLHPDNPAYKNPGFCVSYEGALFYDPGYPEVRSMVAEGVKEIALNYNVDAILFDDYFYPYPTENGVYDDTVSYEKYGNSLPLDDWRRQNVNSMISECYNAVKTANPKCYFGISPFGIWQNDNGSNGGSKTKGLNAYSAIYCDAKAWIEGKYIDFISPQLYWNFESDSAPYGELCDWWDKTLDGSGIPLIVSHGAYRIEEWQNVGEFSHQIEYARTKKSYIGSAMYGYCAIKENSCGISDCLKSIY